MGDINKLLIGSETALATERVSDDAVAVAEKRLNELHKKDEDAGQQLLHLSQRLKFKVTNYSYPPVDIRY